MLIALLFFATFLLAYANGSNDNFKAAATVFGSGTLSYRSALILAKAIEDTSAKNNLGMRCSTRFITVGRGYCRIMRNGW